ncbi:MAG: HNH endonuclease [Limosilactobacillus oris]|jgi:5-methylcytosine-specific restriction endonuclease McrA|uniref:HNH endonuclease signature motif containing protein n=1 Tax=Limosilactobacillus oris TaxID=1632 RepID=UPI0024328584|nr:HNH endonuclease signature motif containing protein [Limosilactobacillus oris]MCH3911282.1 HNH endonuclease [Limosilactobacillus oris]MCH3938532.1 HNH endonuclease [Limosilactobacillus oris]MCI1980279.1 HNH endonuclease [Limosilactobacillus oris]MCI2042636.1 HNH endonuclease [Limosilactobacillus oris]
MGVMRFCNAAGCREVIPVGQYYCSKHQYLQKEYEERKKRWQRDNYQGMTKEEKHKHNQRVYRQRMAASAKAPHDYNRFYKTSAWVKLSHRTLQNSPVCVSCLRKGIIKKADLVDHIEPIRENWDKRLDPSNLQPLCYRCHRIKTKQDHERENKMAQSRQN